MARKIVDLPDGATPEAQLAAVEGVCREITDRWTKHAAGNAKPVTGADAGVLVAELAADVATMANMNRALVDLHRLQLGLPSSRT